MTHVGSLTSLTAAIDSLSGTLASRMKKTFFVAAILICIVHCQVILIVFKRWHSYRKFFIGHRYVLIVTNNVGPANVTVAQSVAKHIVT